MFAFSDNAASIFSNSFNSFVHGFAFHRGKYYHKVQKIEEKIMRESIDRRAPA
jgi:hypothetical protein